MGKNLSILTYTLLLSVNIAFAASQQVATLEKVSLQLKWLHQFQFAGYYAAKEQGYYAAEGLDVDIFERSPNQDVVQQVVSGKRNFAVGDSGILSYYARGEQIVALAAIFQHNPLVFVSKQSSGIISPYEMKGKRIMFDSVGAGDSSLRAMLTDAGLTEKDYTVIKQNFSDEDFINNKIDVMSAYLSNEIFNFQQKNIKINVINPQNYSIDFYGDMLFTSQQELLQHQERTEKFRRATLKGWQYALDYREELVQLIHSKYHSKHSLEHLRFEAEVTRKLILPDIIPLGQIDAGRLRKVAEVYAQLNLSQPLSEKKLAQFIRHSSRSDDKPLIVGSEQNFPPFALGKTDATAGGFTVELWRAVAEEAHLNSKIRVLPWNQVLDEFKAEKIDVLINFAIHDDRRLFADFTVPHVTANEALFVRDDDGGVHSEADLVNKQFIIVKGDFALEYLQEKSWDKQIIFVDTAEEGLQLLANGQHDAMLISKIVGKQTLEKLNISNIKMLPIDIGLSQRFAFAVHKGDAELLAKINEALAIIKANGTYDKLYEKWFGIYEEKELLPLVIKYLTPIVIVFLLMLLVIFYRHSVERKHYTKQLQKNRDELLSYFQQPFIGMLTANYDNHILNVNQRFCDIVGYTPDEMQSIGWEKLIHPDDIAANQAYLDKTIRGEISFYQMEKRYIHKDGHIVYMDVAFQCVRKQDGSPDYFIGVMLDITERKTNEVLLRHNEQKLRDSEGFICSVLDSIPVHIAVLNEEGIIVVANNPWIQFGRQDSAEVLSDSVIGANYLGGYHKPDDRTDSIYNGILDVLAGRRDFFKTEYSSHSHTEDLWFSMTVSPLRGSKRGLVICRENITERKKTEVERERLLKIIEESPDFVGMSDMQANLKYLNIAAKRMVGLSGDADISKLKIDDMHPEWATNLILNEGIPAILEHGFWKREHALLNCVSHTEIPVSQILTVHRDGQGNPQLLSTIMRDITERKQMEADLQRSNADLEQFAYAVSHDMRQPLRMVTSYLALIEKALEKQLDDDTRQFLTFAVDGAKRMDSMILSLLDYSRVGKKSEGMTMISTRAAVDEAILFLKPTLETSGGEVDVQGDWIEVMASRDEFTRLFQNLIGNALKYHQENQPPLVKILAIVLPNTFRVEVKDSGIGINPTQIDRLFKVFSRLQTRSRFEGTGVGLALCRKIVEHHGGKIGVESEGDGKGCTFWFDIPRLSLPLQTEAT